MTTKYHYYTHNLALLNIILLTPTPFLTLYYTHLCTLGQENGAKGCNHGHAGR